MNLEESDSFKNKIEKKARTKKILIFGIVLCSILIALMFCMILLIKYQDQHTDKLFINGVKKESIPSNLYQDISGEIYLNAKTVSDILGYRYNTGDYDQYNQNEKSAYIDTGFEIVSISAEEGRDKAYRKYYKDKVIDNKIGEFIVNYVPNGESFESFKLEKPFLYDEKDQIVLVPIDAAQELFNMKIEWNQYDKKIYSLSYLIQYAQKVVTQNKKFKFKTISNDYENIKAIIDGVVIISDAGEGVVGKYGAYRLDSAEEILGIKYSDIDYMQSSKDFFVTIATSDNNKKVGIMANDGKQIIAPSEYDDIEVLDADKKLYLVKLDDKYGVCDRKGNKIVYAEYSKIGVDVKKFVKDKIKNPSLLFGKVIPVLDNDGTESKYGLYNLEGKEALACTFDSFGYIENERDSSNKINNTLIIPEEVGIRGIVIKQGENYGIFDVDREVIVLPCSSKKIYNIVKDGKKTYYFEFNGEQIELSAFLKEQNLDNKDLMKKDESKKDKDKIKENTKDSKNEETLNNDVIENTEASVSNEVDENFTNNTSEETSNTENESVESEVVKEVE